jgi:phenylacetate-CoA ligase
LVEAPADVFEDAERLSQLERRLTYGVESMLGISCNVTLVGPKQIPRSEGKAVRVVDKRRL